MNKTIGKNDSRRINWIDFIRGFGMILVILGHCSIPDPFWRCIYMFHMPLFFYISGLCHRNGGGYSDKPLRSICQKTIKQYIIPYVLFSLLGFGLTVAFPKVYGLEQPYSSQLAKYAVGIVIAKGSIDYTGNWGAVWFLISQTCLIGMVYIIEKLSNKFRYFATVLIFLAWPANVLLKYKLSTIWLPFNIGAALTGLLIFYLGYVYASFFILRENDLYNKKSNREINIAIGIILIFIGGFIGFKNNGIVAFVSNSYGNVGIMYLSSSLILVGITEVTKVIYSFSLSRATIFRIIEWIGKNTIFFLGIHGMTIPIIRVLSKNILPEVKWYIVAILTLLIDSAGILIFNNMKERIAKVK